jgi:hypothetical protein
VSADDCPVVSTTCLTPVCSSGKCDVIPAPQKTLCVDSGGKLCDGSGQCVGCLTPDDCVNTAVNVCMGSQYTAPPACNGGKCVFNDPVDCATSHKVCKPLIGCTGCTANAECPPPPPGSCKVPVCDSNDGTCGVGNAPLGTSCMTANGAGQCNDTGMCFVGKFVFVTSTAVGSNFGGAATADNKCQGIANAKGWANTTWRSWTSDSTTSPLKRFTKDNLPYRLLDGNVVAGGWTLLTTTPLAHGIDMDENHVTSPIAAQVFAWTGTTAAGVHSGASCGDWMGGNTGTVGGTAGLVGAIDTAWTESVSRPCDGAGPARLYCFQQ